MVNTEGNEQLSFDIIDTQMTIEAMRDSGYKSTTHALAELIDNSIEAGATAIEIFGLSRYKARTSRVSLDELAVLDNGNGMDPLTLRGSLRYGHGTRRNRAGIGRFGVGLPNSSMSQAQRVDIWSWQNGATNAMHTYLSIADVNGGLKEIPEPQLNPVPDIYQDSSLDGLEESGTLVVWSELDRVEWKRASTTFRHTETLLGRIYRRFLATPRDRLYENDSRQDEIGNSRSIRCIPIEANGETWSVQEDDIVYVRPNDPLYLMSGTSCPEKFGSGPMFMELTGSPFHVPISYQGTTYNVQVRATHARPHVRDSSHADANWPQAWQGRDAGNTPWGKHADTNMGVSIVRAHRELEVDPSWVSGDDPTERWWTIEIDFPTQLDELFGVTNNKQGTMTLQRLAAYDWRRERLPDENSASDVRRRMREDGDHRADLLELHKQVINARRLLRERVKQHRQRRSSRHGATEEEKADSKATATIERRIEKGQLADSDRAAQSSSAEEQQEAQVRSLVDRHHLDHDEALQRIRETIENGNRVRWIQTSQNSPAFFDVESLPAVLQVVLNANHPVYQHLFDVMHPDADDLDEGALRHRLARAAAAFRILIYAWARFEEEQTNSQKRHVRDARFEWGKSAEEFFDEPDGDVSPTTMV